MLFLLSRKARGACATCAVFAVPQSGKGSAVACPDHLCLLLSSRPSILTLYALFFSPRSWCPLRCVQNLETSFTPKVSVLPVDINEGSREIGALLSPLPQHLVDPLPEEGIRGDA